MSDVEAGADPQVVLALLDAAQSLSRLRGVKIDPFITGMRKRISLPGTNDRLAGSGARLAPSVPQRQTTAPRWLAPWLPVAMISALSWFGFMVGIHNRSA